ncbi:tetratricopeptide repeat protein [Streptomyces sp. NPDC004111]|uniref:tetratricopeptide repeat protein n=1 Tax=Streptomyces sp. NPDC004111 TaxID=3364690 RepID=UPI003689A191
MSTPATSPEEIRQAIWENRESPNGPSRNARAEELLAAAEQSGDAELVRLGLFNLIDAYEFSTERGKLIVPFARLLQEWDRDPSGFDRWDVQSLHWRFKWVSSGMLDLPDIPLTSIRQWLQEMGRRYAVAGYSVRAVRQSEYYLAYEIGDDEAADRALAAWTSADRDQMSDCHACELNEQGGYWARREQDEKALTTWAPVLEGEHVCAEEPHRVLAEALVPLVRLGRLDEARTYHLRGYRMAKGNESLLRSIGHHIEFCALTGNEARGLEILAEHAGHLGPLNDADAQLGFGGGTLLLLGRLLELGHGALPAAPYQGSPRTVAELHGILLAEATALTARFDVRNGTGASSARLAARLGQRPLVEALPLGVRAGALVARPVTPAAGSSQAAGTVVPEPGVQELAVRARELRSAGHPSADALWDRIEVLAEESGTATGPLLHAELLEHRAIRKGRAGGEPVADGTVRELFWGVVGAFGTAGDPGRAALNGTRVAVAAAQEGAPDEEIRSALDTAAALIGAIPDDDPLKARRLATLELTRIKLEAFTAQRAYAHGRAEQTAEQSAEHGSGHEHGPGHDVAAEARFLAAMGDFVGRYGAGAGDPRETVGEHEGAGAREGADAQWPADPHQLADLVAEAEEALAQEAVQAQDWERADSLLAAAARRNQDAGRPWHAVETLTRLARLRMMLGRLPEAEETARAAVECAAEVTDADELGGARLALAEALYRQDGKEPEAATYALEAAHWFDAAGESAGAGAYARLILAQAYGECDRAAEAAEILESALPDLLEHGEEQAVRARDVLAHLLRQLGEGKAAAEQYLLAADTAKDWDNAPAKARLAMLAGECLAEQEGLGEQAEQAYVRAAQLWQEAGDTFGHVRALRAWAWLAAEEEYDDEGEETGQDLDKARELMGQALAALDGDGPEYRLERARTWSQLGQLLYGDEADGHAQEVVDLNRRAADALREFGPAELAERASCVLRVAWQEKELDRADEGRAALADFVGELKALATESEAAAELLAQMEQRLEHFD